jgi:hypothetical protein
MLKIRENVDIKSYALLKENNYCKTYDFRIKLGNLLLKCLIKRKELHFVYFHSHIEITVQAKIICSLAYQDYCDGKYIFKKIITTTRSRLRIHTL